MSDLVDNERIPDRLDGIDIALGLKRMSGNVGLYRQIAATVLDEYADAAEQAPVAVASGSVDAGAVRRVHTVKGLLGSLGAGDAQEAAQALESAMKSGAAAAGAAGTFAAAYAVVLASLQFVRPGAKALADRPAGYRGRGPRVLVVDDEPANVEVMAETLGDGYGVAGAGSGADALQMAQSVPLPDLILLDVMMPDMDGHEVCRQLKSSPVTRNVPVIFVTAKDDEEDEALGFSLGAVDYITKPAAPEIVRARVRTHVALRHAKAELEARNLDLEEAITAREDMERVMRHDLKGPLNAIVGLPEVLLNRGGLDDRTIRMLRGIRDAGTRMLGMIDLSLDLARMENGTYALQPVCVELTEVLNGVRGELGNLLSGFAVDLAVDVGGGSSVRVWGDEVLVRTLLSNLIKNAVEASPEGGRVAVTVDAGRPVFIAITNEGAVPEAVRDRFFDKYVTSGKRGGTGLGTYSARLMAAAQGGTVELDTSVAGMTTVTVSLPAVPGTD